MRKNKLIVKTKTEQGDDLELSVVRPSAKITAESQAVYAATVARAIQAGALLRERLYTYMVESGAWSEKHEQDLEKINDRIRTNLEKIAKGGIDIEEARNLAIAIRIDRVWKNELLGRQTRLDEATVEGQGDNARFNFLVSTCTVYSTGERYFKDLDDYMLRRTEQAAYDAATQLSYLLYNLSPDAENQLPENQFLTKYGFANAEGALVDKEGHLVNVEGKRIDESGRELDEDGKPVEEKVERLPFLNKDGTPVEEPVAT